MIDIQQNILFGYRQQKVWLTQQNISLIQTNCLFILTKAEYLVDSIKKFISINQNLFDLTKLSLIFNKTVFLVQEKCLSTCMYCFKRVDNKRHCNVRITIIISRKFILKPTLCLSVPPQLATVARIQLQTTLQQIACCASKFAEGVGICISIALHETCEIIVRYVAIHDEQVLVTGTRLGYFSALCFQF